MDQSSSQFLKRTMQFLVSVSLLSFLVSSYSSGLCRLFSDFNFHLTLLFPSFSQTLEKKYVFLICNGIVAFLVKSLSFTSYPAPTGSHISDEFAKTDDEDGVKPVNEAEATIEHNKGVVESTIGTPENVACIEEKQVEQEDGLMYKEVQAQDSQALVVVTEDDEEVEESGSLIVPSSAEEESGNETNESTEELNRKFDEFIRKMKEEIRIEARRQLITV